nr:DUF3142 domain-containing protein [Herbaspirillum seropedicae]
MPFAFLPERSCRRICRGLSWMLLALLLAACSRAPAPGARLPQDAYIWQRQWTPALRTALSASHAHVARWHVLAAELGASGRWIDIDPDVEALANTGRPLLLTVRINGQLARLDAAAIQDHLLERLSAWRRRGLQPAALEIDYDCATARLPQYIAFLRSLKARVAPLDLAVTALPTWLSSPQLASLLAVADESTLQVHAVLDPRLGLFDARLAQDWLHQYAQRTRRPWHVALPAYGARVSWDAQGRIAAVESERPLLAGGLGNELMVDPQVMARFVAQLQASPPAGMAGITWFRLPTGDDRRAWSLSTWIAVLEGKPLKSGLQVQLVAGQDGSTPSDIRLNNEGNADVSLPLRVRIKVRTGDAAPSGNVCSGDGINGYTLENDAQGRYLRLGQAGLLRAGASRTIGWLRCAEGGAAPDITLEMGS